MYKLSHVWESFLEAMIRFWENRFQVREDPLVNLLKIELERERAHSAKLLNVIQELAAPKPIEAEPQEEIDYKPIGKTPWYVKARELEREARERRQKMDAEAKGIQINNPKAAASVDELEAELGVNS